MTAAGTYPDSYKEVCKISIIDTDSNVIVFDGFTEDITAMDWGEKDIEGMALLNGGRVVKNTPMTDESITLKVYPVKADNATTDSVAQLFHPQSTADVTQPIAVDNTITRSQVGLIMLWATVLPADASTLPGDSIPAYRVQVINAYVTKYTPSFDDKHFSAEITLKWAPFAKDATRNKREESTDGSEYLPAAITAPNSF